MNFNVTYDSSVTGQSQAFQNLFHGAVNAALQFYTQAFTNNITVNITFAWASLGQGAVAENSYYYSTYSYATIVNALKATQRSTDDITAYTTLPAADPTGSSGNDFMLTATQARLLGLPFGTTPFDDYVWLNSDFGTSGYTFDPNNRAVSGKFDAIGALEHEISEGVFGRVGNDGLAVNGVSLYTPLDLFRYTSAGVRDFSPGHNDFFSIDGQHLLTEFNNHNQFGGDVSDWYPTIQGDSFGDAYQGVTGAVTATDLRELDILGWNLAGSTQPPPPPPPPPPPQALNLRFVGTGDFTAGGFAAIAWQNGGGAALWVNNGSTFTQASVPKGAMGPEWTAKNVGDFNGDGNADLLWTNTSGQAAIWEMNGANLVGSGVPAGQMSAGWQVAGIGDFNGDGKSDILWVNSGAATIWTMNSTTLANSAISNGRMGAEWQVAAIGDFNNDGRSDVLWENTFGNIAVSEMNGANLSGFVSGVDQMPAGWKIAGVGHFSGAADGTSDVVWVNGTNHVQIWQMNHGKLADVITPNGLDGTEWHLEGVGNFGAGHANSDLLWISDSGAVNIWGVNGSQVTSTLPNAPTGDTLQLSSSAGGGTAQPAGAVRTALGPPTDTGSSPHAPAPPAAELSVFYPGSAGDSWQLATTAPHDSGSTGLVFGQPR
jgi:hypothetical protein